MRPTYLMLAAILCSSCMNSDHFEMNSYGNAELIGGGRGDMFTLLNMPGGRAVNIDWHIDGKYHKTLAKMPADEETWVIITIPEDGKFIHVFDYPNVHQEKIQPTDLDPDYYGATGATNGSAHPADKAVSHAMFFERTYSYTPVTGRREMAVCHQLYLIHK